MGVKLPLGFRSHPKTTLKAKQKKNIFTLFTRNISFPTSETWVRPYRREKIG